MPWSPTTAPSRQRYDDVWPFDENVVVTINSSGEILKTANAGAVWEKKFQTPLIPPRNRAVYLRLSGRDQSHLFRRQCLVYCPLGGLDPGRAADRHA
jgi:hypothetical protein